MASPSFIDKGPSIDWSTDDRTYIADLKCWKQRRELLFTGPMAKIDEEIKCKHLLYWSGEHGIELFNSWEFVCGRAENAGQLLGKIRKFREAALK